MSNLLAIGGPAEGRMLEDCGDEYRHIELVPIVFKSVDYLAPIEPKRTVHHIYIKRTLQFNDLDQRPLVWQKPIYVHNSLTPTAGFNRLREFLLLTFIKGNF